MKRQTLLPGCLPVAANHRFRGFKPSDEGVQLVRNPQVIETVLGKLRYAREVLVDMTPQQAFDSMEFHQKLTLFEAMQLAETAGKLIVPNLVLDRVLFNLLYPVWSGTIVVSEAPNKPFGEHVDYMWEDIEKNSHSIRFEVPKEFRRKVNCALVVEHPDFHLLNFGGNLYEVKLEVASMIYTIEDFHFSGWYSRPIQNTLEIPRAVELLIDSPSWFLFRADHPYIGPIVRDKFDNFSDGGDGERQHFLVQPTHLFGVALFG